ncbi:MAG TPA: hypothetical protein VLA04_00560 [Verrucomicrobiae bacterium]|nr:hypothetical protein [Verrucomicrobiae bacterium]
MFRFLPTSIATYLFLLLLEVPSVHAAEPYKCGYVAGTTGVLVGGKIDSNKPIACYISKILEENMPYVVLAAVILVVISGVQYMLAMGNSAGQGAAKTRIIGIISGIIFYFLIRYMIPLVSGGINL